MHGAAITLAKRFIDIITSYQLAGSDDEELKKRIACKACPG